MIFAVLGGDARQRSLARLLEADGHTVRCFALGAETDCASAADAADGADCVLLPTPVCAGTGVLNTPLSETACSLDEVLSGLSPAQLLLGGRVDADTSQTAARHGLSVTDCMLREELAVGNAAATAEGAVELLLRESPRTLWRSRVLVLGFGRIGRLLCSRLVPFGARVSAAARRKSERVWIEAMGCEALDVDAPEGLERFELLVNTVPSCVLPETQLRRVRKDALLLELASAPGGIDRAAAEKLGLRVLCAPGLPGKTAPQTAAELLRSCIYNIVEEHHG